MGYSSRDSVGDASHWKNEKCGVGAAGTVDGTEVEEDVVGGGVEEGMDGVVVTGG